MATYKGEEINTKPTEAMAENAKRGLEWREEFGRGGTSEPIAGTVTYLYEISGKYWYRLAYDASDRPSGDGTVQYVFTNSGKTAVINLHVSETLDSTEVQSIVDGSQTELVDNLRTINKGVKNASFANGAIPHTDTF